MLWVFWLHLTCSFPNLKFIWNWLLFRKFFYLYHTISTWLLISGQGKYPICDPWDVPFTELNDPARFKVAGTAIGTIPGGAGLWRGVLEGIQSDQDFLRCMFSLQRFASKQLHCHYCDSVQWVSTKSEIGPLNNAESLYTVYGPRESDAPTLHEFLFQRFSHFNLWEISEVIPISFFHSGISWAPQKVFQNISL